MLRHLTRVAGPIKSTPSSHRVTQGHDNVLHYIDAWEQDSTLYIQTELCELGNLSDFLVEYGKTYDRLDEPRLWKIKSEIANVSVVLLPSYLWLTCGDPGCPPYSPFRSNTP